MGFVKDAISGITGANASKRAANAQRAAAGEAIRTQREAKDQAISGFRPFVKEGQEALTGLRSGLEGVQNLVSDPNAQRDFITNNPFFEALAKRSRDDLFANQAARGKLGSGGTAEALQNSLVLLGSDLLNQNINQRLNVNTQFQNLANSGLSAASGQANTLMGAATNIGNFQTQAGNAQAAGIIGAQNARQGAADAAEKRLTDIAKSFAGGVTGGFSL